MVLPVNSVGDFKRFWGVRRALPRGLDFEVQVLTATPHFFNLLDAISGNTFQIRIP